MVCLGPEPATHHQGTPDSKLLGLWPPKALHLYSFIRYPGGDEAQSCSGGCRVPMGDPPLQMLASHFRYGSGPRTFTNGPSSCSCTPWEVADDSSSAWAPNTATGVLDGIPGSCLSLAKHWLWRASGERSRDQKISLSLSAALPFTHEN